MSAEFPRAGFWRRFASLVYDTLAIIAFAMLTVVLYLFAIQGLISLDFIALNGAEDVSARIQDSLLLSGIRSSLLVLVGLVFFGYFWTKSGQTIGMRAWRLKVQTNQGSLISWPQAIIRSISALLGLGNLVVLVDFKNKKALQDYLSKTEVVTLTKEENKRVYRELD
ncbi:RDD family protein [Pseudoalteromonas sp. P1-16-1b]|uniref:RDD family protein n=1 Tax=unclassified Pseudoalteromonas TaxID=194690 RepID=UPI0006D65603|nr:MULTISPECIES: RDD family protein [unclassified Pseudoalteromonas]KPZ64424.1 RDD family protein [Pseudoalteromonas sp. P1-16-1b]TMP72804.1 RDD family protein [Pseudoalteromonas sp. S1609]